MPRKIALLAFGAALSLGLGAAALKASAGSSSPTPGWQATTVAALPTSGVDTGSTYFAANCRAITGVAAFGNGFTVQPAGSGTGCLATWISTRWVIAGTTQTVTQ